MATPGAAFKDEGNELFKAGEYLKAAAAYTKAIKAEPKNHVFYSNRSQAFLKLSKCGKAVEDADKCIALEPTFVKGYHRKASALHATKDAAKIEEAIEVLLGAIEMGLDNNDLVRLGLSIKGKGFIKLADGRRKGEPEPEKPPVEEISTEKSPSDQLGAGVPASPAPTPGQTHLYELDAESFAGLMIKDVFTEVLEKNVVPTIAYLQPGRPAPGVTEEPGLSGVGIEHAFASPSTLSNCAEFLKKHIGDTGSQSAMIIVRKGAVGYPCVWKGKSSWPHPEKQDGIFMQLEARGARALFFTTLSKKKGGGYTVGETAQLDAEDFSLFPRLFT